MTSDLEKIGPMIFGFFGLLILLGASYWIKTTIDFRNSAHVVPGVVIDLIPGDETLAPQFQFQDESGQTHVVTSKTSSNPPAYKKGEQVRVFYQPGNPQKAIIDGFAQNWLIPGGMLIMGLILLSVFIGSRLSQRKSSAPESDRLEPQGT